jgi:hypothetical protein
MYFCSDEGDPPACMHTPVFGLVVHKKATGINACAACALMTTKNTQMLKFSSLFVTTNLETCVVWESFHLLCLAFAK